jgi:hypothetical protein
MGRFTVRDESRARRARHNSSAPARARGENGSTAGEEREREQRRGP